MAIRKTAIVPVLLGYAVSLLPASAAAASAVAAPAAAAGTRFELPRLPWPADALEPAIDAETMEIHHGRHHRAQVDGLNAQLEKHPELASLSLEQILQRVSRYPDAVRNNAGGHWNHAFFWQNLAPARDAGAPSGKLAAAIERDFGSLEDLRKAIEAAAGARFGSGWVWLIVRDDGSLAVTSTANQDNPLMDVVAERGTPVIGVDVWEHAYYLRYRNRRGEYVSNWWKVVNWNDASRRYAEATAAQQH